MRIRTHGCGNELQLPSRFKSTRAGKLLNVLLIGCVSMRRRRRSSGQSKTRFKKQILRREYSMKFNGVCNRKLKLILIFFIKSLKLGKLRLNFRHPTYVNLNTVVVTMQKEYKKIKSEGPEKLAAFKTLVMKQLKLIQTIDDLRCKAVLINRKKVIARKLATMALPKVWELSNGQIIHVQTPATIRAGDLGQLYFELEKKVESMDDRMAILGYVKWTLQVFDTPLTREILNLIQREADLMYRGRSAKSISGLRRRILHRFFRFVEDPQYNPEAVMFANVPTDFDYGKNHFHFMRDAPCKEKLLP